MNPHPVRAETEWRDALIQSQVKAAELFSRSEGQQEALGYLHTLREICQQPWTWLRSCERMMASRELLGCLLAGVRSVALTGSGSSQFAGDSVRLPIQEELGVPVGSIASGVLLMQGARALPTGRPGLLVSLSRSGKSPESGGAIRLLLDSEPAYRHLVLTCNEHGGLAKDGIVGDKVRVLTLPPETHDKSLVMTSSFTNLVLAARFLGMVDKPREYQLLCETLGSAAQDLLLRNFDALARVATMDFQRVVFLGSGTNYAVSCEAALKMLEMTAGRVTTMCETYLGLRHGPMSFIHEDTLVVCHLSSEPTSRAYELDLLRELDRKRLGLGKLIVGRDIPEAVVREGDAVVHCAGLGNLRDDDVAIVYVVVGQLLAFFRCLGEGLHPDSPSAGGVIHRVVEAFPLHTPS